MSNVRPHERRLRFSQPLSVALLAPFGTMPHPPTNWCHSAMQVDIDKLNEAELVDLNNRIVARLKFLSEMRAHAHMLKFRIVQQVSFHPDGQPPVVGIISKYNRKSVTVITVEGQKWTVAPAFLSAAEIRSASAAASGQVINMPKK